MIKLEMNFIAGNLCVNIGLWSKKEKQFKKAIALFDTGAHTTHIDTNILKELGYNLANAGKSFINAVGSSNMQVNNIALDNLKIGELELGVVAVNFSELSDVSSSVILGMNIIKEFNIELNFENKLISMKPNFDVDSVISVDNFNKRGSRFGMWVIDINRGEQ